MSASRRGVLALLATVGLVSIGVGIFVATSNSDDAVGAGKVAPQFELQTLEGDRISLASLRGKVVYVNFWATWCAPCREEAPALQRLYESLREDGFELVAATIDKPADIDAVRAFKTEFGLTFPILLDPDEIAYGRFGATGVPETYLIDAEGRLAEAYIGPRDWEEPRYARAIRRLLEKRSTANVSR